MSKRHEIQRRHDENQRNYIDSLQRQCLPGEKLMTCPYCRHIGRYPEWQLEVSCIRGYGCGRGIGQHLNEIKGTR